MKTTLVVTATPNPEESSSVQEYLQGVFPLLMSAGGTPVKRLSVAQVVRGEPKGMVLVMDFPDREVVEDLFSSAEYAALVPARDRGFTSMDILLAGDM
ncbi:MAG: DUF1330 domain-containing protein [Gemmatimonadota bacterium]